MEKLAILPILLMLLILHELGHFVTARLNGIKVEEFAVGFPPRIASVVRGGIRYSLNLLPLGAYVRMLGEEDPTSPGSFASKSKSQRAVVLAAGPAVNLISAVLVFALAYGTGWPDPSAAIVRVQEVVAGTPAEQAGLQAGDVLRLANGQALGSPAQFRDFTDAHLGQLIVLTVERQSQMLDLPIVPRASWPQGQGPLGIRLSTTLVPVPHDPISSLGFGLRQTFDLVGLTLSAPVMAIRGDLPFEDVRPIGLPGMTQLAGEAAQTVVQTGSFFFVLLLTATLSAGMGVFNFLPLPALDGGRLLFVAIEAVRGRRLAPEREALIHLAGFVALISIVAAVSLYELSSPLPLFGPR
jgi:regulator of sigma E protease